MTRVNKTIHVGTSVERAFDYVTTPGNWPAWHPSSLKVSGATDHSLKPGEQVTEEFYVAGRRASERHRAGGSSKVKCKVVAAGRLPIS